MQFISVTIAAAAALSLSACTTGPSDDARAVMDQAQDVGASVQGGVEAASVSSAQDYVTNAAIADLYEVRSSQLAQTRSQSQEVRAFAQQMITDHTATTNQLRPLASGAGLSLPTTLDARRQQMLQNLESASADDFDDRYIDQQTAAHQEALTLHRTYAAQGELAELKSFANQVAPRIEQHLTHVRTLDQSAADD
jgi:putative membrane protein